MKKLLPTLLLSLCLYSGYSQNAPFTDIGFESMPNGANTSTAWITAFQSAQTSVLCPAQNTPSYTPYNQTAYVRTLPIENISVDHIGYSPFVGNKVIALNNESNSYCYRTRMTQNFWVTNANKIYRYAYKGVLDFQHVLCGSGAFVFRFYDCSNNLITALSKTVCVANSNAVNIDANSWVLGTFTKPGGSLFQLAHTPDWVLHSADLSAYIGSCITVEVIVSACPCCGAMGYMYYDNESSSSLIETTANTIRGANSFTTCGLSSTLRGLPGYSSYLWQGPVSSGISGSTSSVITTSTSGSYTLTAFSGTASSSETFSLALAPPPSVVLTANTPTTCLGGTVTLQASGNNLSNFIWNAAASNASVLAATPADTTFYSVFAYNSAGCASYASTLIPVVESPKLVQISPSSPSVCAGHTVSLTATGNANVTYTWSTASNSSLITQALPAATSFILSATNTLGCVSSDTITVGVYSVTPVQIAASTTLACVGQNVMLSLPGTGVATYTWSTTQMNQPLVFPLSANATYSVSVTDQNGCNSQASIVLTTLPLPDVQLSATPPQLCLGGWVSLTASSSQPVSYLWGGSAGGASLSDLPTATTIYSVSALAANGCLGTATVAVDVWPLPQVQILAPAAICKGQTVVLEASDLTLASYAWSSGGSGSSEFVSPQATTHYTLAVTDANGCSSSATRVVQVDACTGIVQNSPVAAAGLVVFPNPSSGAFTIRAERELNGYIFNQWGQKVKPFHLNADNHFSLSISGLSSGVYSLQSNGGCLRIVID